MWHRYDLSNFKLQLCLTSVCFTVVIVNLTKYAARSNEKCHPWSRNVMMAMACDFVLKK